MNSLTIREVPSMEYVMKDLENVQKMCAMLMRTKHYQKLGEDGIFAIVLKARSLNIDIFDALNGSLYYLQGKVSMSSEMMNALIRSKGHSITKDKSSDDTICILHGKRADNGNEWTVSFSMADAKRAGLARGLYEKYPPAMLYNRCMSMLARQLFPDEIKGVSYTNEELIEIKNSDRQKIIENTIETVELITDEQATELLDILSECDEGYRKAVMSFIAKPPINANSISDLPAAMYARVKIAAVAKREEARKTTEQPEQIAVGE